MKRFEFLEHTADVYIAAYGKTLEEAFENAAYATSEVMTEADRIAPKIEENVEVEGYDEQALLYNWLETFLFRFDTTGKLYSRFKVFKIEKRMESFYMEAKIWGETYSPERHRAKVGIKAVTYHLMEIIKNPEQITVRFVLDV